MAPLHSSILLALRELDLWKQREAALTDPVERDQASRQVAYYRRLVMAMKRQLAPTQVSSVVHTFFR